MFGVDEAGRGPVLGSLFVACVSADATALPDGTDDSKRLAPARREALAAELRADERVTIAVSEVTPTEIDDGRLNGLTVAAMADAIDRAVPTGESGIIDACDTDAERFGRRVRAETATDVELAAEHGADESHEHVGAASIVAKVARDAHVADLAAEHGAIGSGYPGDGTTREFLREYVREHGGLPPFARASWKTSRDVLEAADQSALADF
ncbi:ribonuclease HII [Halococcus morrhuae DSM 1307]|uniref:Ribonuclease n=1 Tax=Halococcus morrhuae DSM 1307 TaxID=931277 RepID=M0MT01_HALMO|nr:ribonuclease HII [Halococcus morrhuae]EMA48468.1 ribonuclease HII [Halococcus morrhuae DSM 1307]